MLTFGLPRGIRHCDGLTRREVMRVGAIGLGGLSLPHLLRAGETSAKPETPRSQPRARSVVILYLSGGPSQLDMWDMKPEAPLEIRGTFRPIDTRVPGIQVCEHMPRMARVADKYTIVRSMSHGEAEHLRAGYWVMTGAPMLRPVVQASGMIREDRPHAGAVLSRFLKRPRTMPPFVMIPEFISPVGVPRPGQHAGFLGAEDDPYLVNSDPNLPDYSPGELSLAVASSTVATCRVAGRSCGWSTSGWTTWRTRPPDGTWSRTIPRRSTWSSRRPPAAPSTCRSESDATRDRYGRHVFGQSVLVARRLVEAGVRLVQVNFVRHDKGKGGQGYDSHSSPPNPPAPELGQDRAAATDRRGLRLAHRGPGRPRPARRDAGDHDGRVRPHAPVQRATAAATTGPSCYSVVLAGGGIRGGQVYGASDKLASTPLSDPVSPEDLLATLYHLVGLDPRTEIHDLQDRPFPITTGKPVSGLLI